jgi:uncharacterized OB-fold protein
MSGVTVTRKPVREGLFYDPLGDLSTVRLAGSACGACGETHLGTVPLCPNCGNEALEVVPLSRSGTVWTYTLVRHRPPGDYRGPDPFTPLPVALVELPDGLRVLSPLRVPEAHLAIGAPVELRIEPLFEEDGHEVVAFVFEQPEELR